MATILNAHHYIEAKAKALMEVALDAGGEDNLTIIIAEIN
ncbi:hypothetical protein GMMP1_690006 [Candidatus Magnetomoraceae bacterium gMMP-1]